MQVRLVIQPDTHYGPNLMHQEFWVRFHCCNGCSLQLVGLQFDTFSTEECCDFVYIYNGDSTKSPLLRSLSGSLPGPVGIFNSTQRYLYVRFVTDTTDTDTGFTATFASTNSGTERVCMIQKYKNTTEPLSYFVICFKQKRSADN